MSVIRHVDKLLPLLPGLAKYSSSFILSPSSESRKKHSSPLPDSSECVGAYTANTNTQNTYKICNNFQNK